MVQCWPQNSEVEGFRDEEWTLAKETNNSFKNNNKNSEPVLILGSFCREADGD